LQPKPYQDVELAQVEALLFTSGREHQHADSSVEDSHTRKSKLVNLENLTVGRELSDASKAQLSLTKALIIRLEREVNPE